MAKKVLVKDNKVLSLHSGKVLGAPENYDLDTYLNFYMPFGGTITLRRVGSPTVVELEYSTDGCRTWQIWEEVGTDRTLTLPQEGRVWIRNTSETSTRFSIAENSNYYRFYLSNTTFAYGQLLSLLCKDISNAQVTAYCFCRLFSSCITLVKTPKFPAQSADHAMTRCYASCLSLYYVEDILNASRHRCCAIMFNECRSLDRIVLRVTSYGTQAFNNWNQFVQSSGDFYCPAELTISTGYNGIPTGWTRHDLSELT